MVDLDPKVLNDQLNAAGAYVLSLKRKPGKGYQGPLHYKRCVLVVVAQDDMGVEHFVDPAEVGDADPDVFARDYVRVGAENTGIDVVAFLEKFLLILIPQSAGPIAWLRGLFGK